MEKYKVVLSPTTRITSIRVVFSPITIPELIVYQMDIKTDLLNGELEQEIYMDYLNVLKFLDKKKNM